MSEEASLRDIDEEWEGCDASLAVLGEEVANLCDAWEVEERGGCGELARSSAFLQWFLRSLGST